MTYYTGKYISQEDTVRAIISKLTADQEIDAWGVSRKSGISPLRSDYILQQLVRSGEAITTCGRWYGNPKGEQNNQKQCPTVLDPTNYTSTSTNPPKTEKTR